MRQVADTIFRISAWAALLAGLTLPTFAPKLSNNLMWPVLALGLMSWLSTPGRATILSLRAAWVPLLGGLLVLIASAFTASSIMGVVAVLVFGHLYLTGALISLFNRLDRATILMAVGAFALLGAMGGTFVVGFDVLVLGDVRGGFANNPVRMAELILPLGFTAVVGFWGTSRRTRWLFLLGPVVAIAGVYFTGSRGPMLASVPMLLVTFSALCIIGNSSTRAFQVQLFGYSALLVVATTLLLTAPPIPIHAVDSVRAALGGGGPVDGSTAERLSMYRAAYGAFLASPWVGHGLIDYVKTAATFMVPGDYFAIYDHLHNDIANFAVAAGGLGIAAYFLFLLSPIASALRIKGPERMPMLYLGVITSICFACLGLTDTTFGVHWQNIVFVTILAVIGIFEYRSKLERASPPL